MELPSLKLDRDGLVTVVAQDVATGEIRMVAHADREALERTAETGLAHFFSRSRGRQWMKGEESGNVMAVSSIWLDCDADAVIYRVTPSGPTCHTGTESCFFRRAHPVEGEEAARPRPVLEALTELIEARKSDDAQKSYTRSLLDGGARRIGAKLREEADELAGALEGETDERVASEAADLLYHAMVGLASRGLSLRDVEAVLAARFGVSGHEEKRGRG